MKTAGSWFVEDDVRVMDMPATGQWAVSVTFDSSELAVHMTEDIATKLHSQLGDALRSLEHDRESA